MSGQNSFVHIGFNYSDQLYLIRSERSLYYPQLIFYSYTEYRSPVAWFDNINPLTADEAYIRVFIFY